MNNSITVETIVKAPIEKVWELFTDSEAIKAWNNASPDWHTTSATNDLKVGGKFDYRMEAKDGSAGFNLVGAYDEVRPLEYIAYHLEDDRKVTTSFVPSEGGVKVSSTFEAEKINSEEMQRGGWQAILDNFKAYVESHNGDQK